MAPPTNLRNLDAVREYYRRVHGATSLPIVVQDEPVFSGVVMAAASQPVAVFGGMGGVYFYEELLRGAAGTMTGLAELNELLEALGLARAGVQPVSLQRAAARA